MDWDSLRRRKKALDRLRPLKPELAKNLEEWLRVELTYASNAIEGNTLTRAETAIVIEKGLTVGGRSLREHLEAVNHAAALDRIKELAGRPGKPPVTERDILTLHAMILKGIDDENTGRYRSVPVRIAGSRAVMPNPAKVPALMRDFTAWLKKDRSRHPAAFASEAHYRLVTIHPFVDGNGRTARLLMNQLLMRAGYPPALLRREDRLAYINSLEKAQSGRPREDFDRLMLKSVERGLDITLRAARGRPPGRESRAEPSLLRIGALARKTGENHSTLRHWTKEGLLQPADTTASGYLLYPPEAAETAKKIREFQRQRRSLVEIRDLLSG